MSPAGDARPEWQAGLPYSEAAAILLVIDLVHIPLHQAVELLHGIFDKRQRAWQDPLEVTAQDLLDPVRFWLDVMAHDETPYVVAQRHRQY